MQDGVWKQKQDKGSYIPHVMKKLMRLVTVAASTRYPATEVCNGREGTMFVWKYYSFWHSTRACRVRRMRPILWLRTRFIGTQLFFALQFVSNRYTKSDAYACMLYSQQMSHAQLRGAEPLMWDLEG